MARTFELGKAIVQNPEWRTRYAYGICSLFSAGKYLWGIREFTGKEALTETNWEIAVCMAKIWELNPKYFDEDLAAVYVGRDIWELAKQVVVYGLEDYVLHAGLVKLEDGKITIDKEKLKTLCREEDGKIVCNVEALLPVVKKE